MDTPATETLAALCHTTDRLALERVCARHDDATGLGPLLPRDRALLRVLTLAERRRLRWWYQCVWPVYDQATYPRVAPDAETRDLIDVAVGLCYTTLRVQATRTQATRTQATRR